MSKRKRAGQIALDELKLSVVRALSQEGQTLDEIVAREEISAGLSSIYGSVCRKGVKVVQNFLACGLDKRFKVEAGKYVASDGVDGRKSVTSTTLGRVLCNATGKACVVVNPLLLAELLFGKKGRDGAHSAFLQNHGKGNQYGGYEWTVVEGGPHCSPQAAHAFFVQPVFEWVD